VKTLRILWRMITYRPIIYGTVLFLWIGYNLMELVPGLLAKAFFDTITHNAAAGLNVQSIVALVILAAFIHMGLLSSGWFFDIRYRFYVSALLWLNTLSRILNLPAVQATSGSPGETISTFRDDVQVLEDASDWVIDTITQAIFLPVALWIMIRINPQITFLTVLPLFGIVLITRFTSSRVKRYREASRHATEEVTGAISEVLTAIQAVQLANAEDHVRGYVARLNDQRRAMMVNDSVFQQALESIFTNSATLATGIILLVAAQSMQRGGFTIGDFALFVAYLNSLALFMTQFGVFLAQLKQAGVSIDRLTNVAAGRPAAQQTNDLPAQASDTILTHLPIHLSGSLPMTPLAREQTMHVNAHPIDRSAPILEVENLAFRFNSDSQGQGYGLEGISFRLERGSFTVVTGRIGSGKTTLLRTVLGLLPREQGRIFWNGALIDQPADFLIPPRCAYTPQVPHLFSTSLFENIVLGANFPRGEIQRAIYMAVLEEDLATMAYGLHTIVGPKGVRLSGGQVQRTAAARMFLRRPELFVFDDLSSALDVETETKLWKRLLGEASNNGGKNGSNPSPTFLIVSHRKPALQRANQIIVLKDGRVNAIGHLDELLKRNAEMQHLWSSDTLMEQAPNTP
jgi:ATP-binding cassette subfamily B protein